MSNNEEVQKERDTMLINTLNSFADSIKELDKRLRHVEEGLRSTQDVMLKLYPELINKKDIKNEQS